MDLWRLSAVAAVELLREKKVTPLQLVHAAEERWKATEPSLNAMPITCWERARQRAQQLMDEGFPERAPRGYLYGLPVAVKDLTAVKGLPFTEGSLLFRDRVADRDDPLVQRLEEKGAIVVGKTNTPEFGAGSQTYNQVFGTTLNPWDTTKTSGGSSGGSAAALAAGQVWLATGTDFGGSLRNPASFCGVVGMRPSDGVVPQQQPRAQLGGGGGSGPPRAGSPRAGSPAWRVRSVSGVMARSVPDLALAFDAVTGEHEGDPVALPAPERPFAASLAPGALGPPRRVAFSPDLGVGPVCGEVVALCRRAAQWWAAQGAEVAEDQPDLADAPEVFEVFRAYVFQDHAARFLGDQAALATMKPELVWQLQSAADLAQEQVDRAMAAHDRLLEGMRAFFQRYDLLLCPTAMMPPFDATIHWPREFQGVVFNTYIDWLRPCSAISVLGLPAISVPCGLTAAGLPVGLQLVGPPGGDAVVLAAAAAFERAHDLHTHVPKDVAQRGS